MSLVPILGALFGTANGWGYIGESKVSVAAMFGLPRPTYTPFRDVTLPVSRRHNPSRPCIRS